MDNVSITGSDVDSKTNDVPETEKGLHFIEPAHSVQVLTGLNSLRLARMFCDVTLCVDDQEFTCHKNVLASFSPYFRAMFTGDLAESQQDRVSLKGVDASTFRQLVDYAYTSEIDVTETNVHSLLSAANLFNILPVRDACCTFLQKIMDGTNCLGIRCFAEAHACYDLQEKAKAVILRNFSEVAAQDEFLQITSTKLTEFLSDDLLLVDSEEDVFEAVMRWYEHDPETRGTNFEKVFEQVRLPLMSPYYLRDRVETAPVIQQTPACRQLLKEAVTYHPLPDRRAELGSVRTISRKMTGKKEVIVFMGGHSWDRLQCVDGFSPRSRQWISIAHLPYAVVGPDLVTLGCNELYVAGTLHLGERNYFLKYDPTLDSWLEMTPMTVPRSHLALAELDGYIYAVGGWGGASGPLRSVERYDVNNNSWQMVAPMKVDVTHPVVVSVGGQLYVMGINDVHKTVQKFDPRTETWVVVAPMLNARSGSTACVLNGHIFIIGGYDAGKDATNKVVSYDPNKDEWRARESMKKRRLRPGAAVSDGRIYVFGGQYDEERFTRSRHTIECYDPDKDSWEVVGKMPSRHGRFSCAVLHLPKETRKRTNSDAGPSHPGCSRHH